MSIQLDWYLNCDNKAEDCCQMFKRMVLTDSAGHLYLATDSLITGAGSTYNFTFVNGDLTTYNGHTGILVNHGFDSYMYTYVVKDENGNLQFLAEDSIDANQTFIQIDAVISGTWEGTMYKF